MLDYYKPGFLERKIEHIYQEHGILTPRDLRLENLAHVFQVDILYNPIASFTVWDEEDCLMNLKEGLSEFAYKKHFFHELGHRINHIGNQMELPSYIEDWMEEDARHFESMAMMPFFMIASREPWEISDPYALATIFDVPVTYVEARLRFIYGRAEAWYIYEHERQAYGM